MTIRIFHKSCYLWRTNYAYKYSTTCLKAIHYTHYSIRVLLCSASTALRHATLSRQTAQAAAVGSTHSPYTGLQCTPEFYKDCGDWCSDVYRSDERWRCGLIIWNPPARRAGFNHLRLHCSASCFSHAQYAPNSILSSGSACSSTSTSDASDEFNVPEGDT